MKTNREATMGLLKTLMRFGIVDRPTIDFPMFLVWFKDIKRYSDEYGLKDEVESA
jgi:hypothetical protein